MALAQPAMVVDSLAPGRLRLGVGPSHEPAMRGTWGLDFTRPLEHLRQYVSILNACFKDGKVDFAGKRLHAHAEFAGTANIPVMISALHGYSMLQADDWAPGCHIEVPYRRLRSRWTARRAARACRLNVSTR
jgi:alkanesulfonate monooxygenase SsuD/methylene tetrahydromethanopterin reductase-like flavin-dependent oxidoreductase (luciferase family)